MRLRKYNKSLGWMSLIASTVLLSGCDSALLDPKGQIGLEQRSLILTAFGLMMIVVIPAVLMAVGFAWKYRASNKDAKYSPELVTLQQSGSCGLDGTYSDHPVPGRSDLENHSRTGAKQTACPRRETNHHRSRFDGLEMVLYLSGTGYCYR